MLTENSGLTGKTITVTSKCYDSVSKTRKCFLQEVRHNRCINQDYTFEGCDSLKAEHNIVLTKKFFGLHWA